MYLLILSYIISNLVHESIYLLILQSHSLIANDNLLEDELPVESEELGLPLHVTRFSYSPMQQKFLAFFEIYDVLSKDSVLPSSSTMMTDRRIEVAGDSMAVMMGPSTSTSASASTSTSTPRGGVQSVFEPAARSRYCLTTDNKNATKPMHKGKDGFFIGTNHLVSIPRIQSIFYIFEDSLQFT
jgi:hypothetical protein